MTAWWRNAVIYQVYPRSFCDASGDGIGDLPGILRHIGYLRDLGVDAIWLNPFYVSPHADGGYDVADYRDVDALFGTMADFDALVAAAHSADIRVIVDLVPNHTSDRHPWFVEAAAAPADSVARRRYLFRDGIGPRGELPPNNWCSVFGGAAWTRISEPDGRPGQWYLHLFDSSQPDLDWTNPEVRGEFESILRFWLARDVDGFRIDVAHGLVKHPAMADLTPAQLTDETDRGEHPHWDRDELHDVYRAWRRVIDEYDGERVLVGEVGLRDLDRIARYLRADELHSAFNFEFLVAPFDATSMRAVIDRSISSHAAVGAPPTWVLSNHDKPRHVTRYGDGEIGLRRARAAALLMLGLPGGAYIYQGEELGLPEVLDLPDELRQDPAFTRTGGEDGHRDGCRVPLPWSGDSPPFGFGSGGSPPWLPQPAAWATLTAERQAQEPGSTLGLYRSALRLRRHFLAEFVDPDDETLTWVEADEPDMLVFRRGRFACAVNFGDQAVAVPAEIASLDAVLSSLTDSELAADDVLAGGLLAPAAAVWLIDSATIVAD